jgi:hypothetical protein
MLYFAAPIVANDVCTFGSFVSLRKHSKRSFISLLTLLAQK